MSMQSKQLLAPVITVVENGLKVLGFRKTKGVYVRSLGYGAIGWLGLNSATHRSDGRVGINPVVGVRLERIEDIVAELMGEKGARFGPTISTPLGYLMPEARYLEWLFEPTPFDYESESQRMVKAVEVYGIPFMTENGTLESLVRNLKQLRFTSKEMAVYRLPIAHLLAGETSLAVSYVDSQVKELGDRDDLAARQYKTFASNLIQYGSQKR